MNIKHTIAVTKLDDSGDELQFEVMLSCCEHSSFHHVTLQEKEYKQITDGLVEEGQFVKDCFHFLLERESQQSIMSSFDISVIENYFSDFKEIMYDKYHTVVKEESFLKRVLFR